MHVEARAMIDPIEQAAKFVEIQAKDKQLDALDESNRDEKKEICNLCPTVQEEYIHM